MERLKNFKLFERGDGVEEEDNMPTYNMKLDDDGKYSMEDIVVETDYILSIPSGEIIYLDEKELKSLINDKMVDYSYSFKGNTLNCYCFNSSRINLINNYLNDLRKKNPNVQVEKVAKEFSREMSNVIGRKCVVGTFTVNVASSNTIDYYVIIIPDLSFNRHFYNKKLEKMQYILSIMKERHKNSVFYYADKINTKNDVIYYGLGAENPSVPKS